MEILKPTRSGFTRASQLVASGGVIAFPTDTVYGLGVSSTDELAQKRVFRLKGRPAGMPLILLAAARSQLEGWVHPDPRADELMERYWPGPLTLVLHADGGRTLGVRIPNHKVALELLRATGPLMTTSANLHQAEPAMTAEEAALLADLAAVLDGGRAPGGVASTVVDLTGPQAHVLREGALSAAEVIGPPPPRTG